VNGFFPNVLSKVEGQAQGERIKTDHGELVEPGERLLSWEKKKTILVSIQ
jgi:hypothetical protein